MKNKKVILVGSAGYLNKAGLGSYIDEFDIVWRTNFTGHPHTIESYPEIVGSKYGNWFIHAIQWGGFKFKNNKFINVFKNINKYDKIILNGNEIELKQCNIVNPSFVKNVDPNTWLNLYRFVDKSKIFREQINKNIKYDSAFKSNFNNVYLLYLNAMKDCYSMLDNYNINLLKPPIQKPSSGLRILTYLLKKYEHIHLVGFDKGVSGNFLYHQNIYDRLNSLGVGLRNQKNHNITKKENNTGKKSDGRIAKHHLSAEYEFLDKLQKQGRITIV